MLESPSVFISSCQLVGKITLFETNFYNDGGSKLKAVCSEFRSLNDELNAQNIQFVWATDGPGWHTAKQPLEEVYNYNYYMLDLGMLEAGALNELTW